MARESTFRLVVGIIVICLISLVCTAPMPPSESTRTPVNNPTLPPTVVQPSETPAPITGVPGTPAATLTVAPTETPIPLPTVTQSATVAVTLTPAPTDTGALELTAVPTLVTGATATAAATPEPTFVSSPTMTETATAEPTSVPPPTSTETPTTVGTATPNPTITETPTPDALSPIFWWTFDEDSSPYAESTGTLPAAPSIGTTSAPGVFGNGVRFPANATAYVDLGIFDLPQDIGTLTMWVKPASTSDHWHLITKGFSGDSPWEWAFSVRLLSNGTIRMGSGMSGDSGADSPPGIIHFGAWQHIAISWPDHRFFVNGVRYDPVWVTGVVVPAPHAEMPVALASWGERYYPEVAFKGDIDEIKVFHRRLSTEEIAIEASR